MHMKITVSFGYKRKELLFTNFEASFPDKKITVLCGHNGAGKTTLLKVISGVFPSEFSLDDTWFVPASGGLIYHFSLKKHLDMLLGNKGIQPKTLIAEAISVFEASDFINKTVSSLSTGQVMLSSIIVALASGKKTLLLDEPFGCLDPENAEKLSLLLKKVSDSGITVLLTSHDLGMTAQIADHLIFIKNGTNVYETDMNSETTPSFLLEKYKQVC